MLSAPFCVRFPYLQMGTACPRLFNPQVRNSRMNHKMPSREMVPLLQQRTLLRNLGQSYRLELLDSKPLTNQDEVRYQHIRAQRQEETTGRAEVIELWVHSHSSVIARLRLQVPLDSGEQRLVTLDLVSEEPLPRD
jgi:hypothetical protein